MNPSRDPLLTALARLNDMGGQLTSGEHCVVQYVKWGCAHGYALEGDTRAAFLALVTRLLSPALAAELAGQQRLFEVQP